MEGKQEKGRKVKGEERTGRRSSEAGAKADIAMTISVAKETNAPSVGNNKACSNRRSREDKCGGSERVRTGNGNPKKGLLYNGGGQREELLCMQEFWAHGPSLQE